MGELSVTYPRFELWWKERLGIDYPDIPVLPEYMVQVVSENSVLEMKRSRQARLEKRRQSYGDSK